MRLTCLFLLLVATLRAQNPLPAPEQASPLAIFGGTVHIGNGQVIQNATILLRDGNIERIGAGGTIPDGYERIDASGKEIYPGLIALNTQLGLTEINAVRSTRDYREVGTYNPNARAQIAFNTDSQIIPTVRSRGVLIAQAVPEGTLVAGRSALMQLDGWNFEDATVRADDGIHIYWPRRQFYNWRTGTLKPNEKYPEQVTQLRQFLQQAGAYCGRGADAGPDRLVKLEAFCDALSGDANAYLHADEARDIQAGVLLIEQSGGSPVIIGGYQAYLIPDFMKEHGVPVILESTQALPPTQDAAIDGPYASPARMEEAGIDFAISHGGSWEQRNLPFVAGQAVGFGLDYESAVEAVTLAPARITGIDDRYGSLEEGKSATLVIASGDLLDMRTSNVERAFIDGRSVDLDNKQAELARKFREKYARKARR